MTEAVVCAAAGAVVCVAGAEALLTTTQGRWAGLRMQAPATERCWTAAERAMFFGVLWCCCCREEGEWGAMRSCCGVVSWRLPASQFTCRKK